MPRNEDECLIIGAVGGSGTRAICEALMRAGWFMGRDLNDALDSLCFQDFVNRALSPLLRVAGRIDYDPDALDPSAVAAGMAALEPCVEAKLAELDAQAGGWGFKLPRSILALPLMKAAFPNMRFLHVIRDGRDMAFSRNRNQLRKHYEALTGEAFVEDPVQMAAWWSRINLEARSWSERQLGDRYACLRFEDVIDDPAAAFGAIEGFLGTGIPPGAVDHVKQVDSRGRWRERSAAMRAAVTEAAAEGLAAFGYQD